MSHLGNSSRRMRSDGFTLYQLLCCLALIPITLMLMVAFISRPSMSRSTTVAKKQVALLDDAIANYLADVGRRPTTEQGLEALVLAPSDLADRAKWKGPYLDDPHLPFDPWNNPFQYEADPDEHHFLIWSNGPDGQSGTDDDISTEL